MQLSDQDLFFTTTRFPENSRKPSPDSLRQKTRLPTASRFPNPCDATGLKPATPGVWDHSTDHTSTAGQVWGRSGSVDHGVLVLPWRRGRSWTHSSCQSRQISMSRVLSSLGANSWVISSCPVRITSASICSSSVEELRDLQSVPAVVPNEQNLSTVFCFYICFSVPTFTVVLRLQHKTCRPECWSWETDQNLVCRNKSVSLVRRTQTTAETEPSDEWNWAKVQWSKT